MISVDDKIKVVNEMCKGLWAFEMDNMFKYLYPFTTEHIAGYLPYFDLKDKSLLTVGSSGDQALNAILMGSKDITITDLCMFAKEYFNLKKAAISSLSREDYLKFFCYSHYNGKKTNHYAFNKKSYLKLRDALKSYDNESLYFWDYLFSQHRPIKLRRRMFNYDESSRGNISMFNEYIKSDLTYDELKNKIPNVNVDFTIGNISDAWYGREFDNIFLSNINTYCSCSQLKVIYDNMFKYLNDNGKILIAYLYCTDILDLENGVREDQMSNFNSILSILPEDIEMYSFLGVGGIKTGNDKFKDSIITYKKVKKI